MMFVNSASHNGLFCAEYHASVAGSGGLRRQAVPAPKPRRLYRGGSRRFQSAVFMPRRFEASNPDSWLLANNPSTATAVPLRESPTAISTQLAATLSTGEALLCAAKI